MTVGVLAGACRVDVGVEVEVNGNGTGEVRARADLDAAAVAELGGETPEKRLALADLAESGWRIEGPTKKPDGGLGVVVRHGFDGVDEARALMLELAGAEGPLRGFELSRERSFLKTTTRFRGVVDLRSGLGAFTDAELRAALEGPNGEPLGVDDAQLTQRFGRPVAEMFGFTVAADLPGDVDSNAPPSATSGSSGAARWTPGFGEEVTLEADSVVWNIANIASALIAGTAALALAGVLLRRRGGPADTDRPPYDQEGDKETAKDPPAEEPPAEDPPAEDPPAEEPPAEEPPADDPPAEEPGEDPPPAG